MIECVFTLDYEIFGNGTGSLRDLVYEPARMLMETFRAHDARLVAFVEAAELQKIEAQGSDVAIDLVQAQIKELYEQGFEIGLHLHPQWCNAQFANGMWLLDYEEYNLCKLPRPRIAEIVGSALGYLRHVLDDSRFTPLSFRAGNWLFQPTLEAAGVLAEHGIKVDSSVFKGGLQHRHSLDYRASLRNGPFWRFEADVNQPDPAGAWLEVPIYSEMVPLWKMSTGRRLGMGAGAARVGSEISQKFGRMRDFLRFRYPLKLDFCRMTLAEMISMFGNILREDQGSPAEYRPIVAIGHTKDFPDAATIGEFLSFLKSQEIAVSTFSEVYPKLVELSN
jgi:hypothetical protein